MSKASSSTSPRRCRAGSSAWRSAAATRSLPGAVLYALDAVSEAAEARGPRQVAAAEARLGSEARPAAAGTGGHAGADRRRRRSTRNAPRPSSRGTRRSGAPAASRRRSSTTRSALAARARAWSRRRAGSPLPGCPAAASRSRRRRPCSTARARRLEPPGGSAEDGRRRALGVASPTRCSARASGLPPAAGRAHAAAAERQIRFFVPEAVVGSLAAGRPVAVPIATAAAPRSRPGSATSPPGRVHAAGDLQQRDARQARLHGRGAAVGRGRQAPAPGAAGQRRAAMNHDDGAAPVIDVRDIHKALRQQGGRRRRLAARRPRRIFGFLGPSGSSGRPRSA